jgi:hypothetical protein
MILKVKLLGSGNPKDPYRVNLPTYSHIHGNVTEGWALVLVPEDVHGLSADDLKHEDVHETTEGPYYPALCGDCVGKIHAHFDQKYADHEGRFRVETVK